MRWMILAVVLIVLGAGCSKEAQDTVTLVPSENATTTNTANESMESVTTVTVANPANTTVRFEISFPKELPALYINTLEFPTKSKPIRVARNVVLNSSPAAYDVSLPPGNYTKILLELNEDGDLDTQWAALEYEFPISLDVSGGAEVQVEIEMRAAAEHRVGDRTYLIPAWHFEIGQERQTFEWTRVATEDALEDSLESCTEFCEDECKEEFPDCDQCESQVEQGCELESEEDCRDICDRYMAPHVCRDGCQEDSVTECTKDLQLQCRTHCNLTAKISTCASPCIAQCPR